MQSFCTSESILVSNQTCHRGWLCRSYLFLCPSNSSHADWSECIWHFDASMTLYSMSAMSSFWCSELEHFFLGGEVFYHFYCSLLLLRWSSWRHLPVGYFSCFSTRHRELTPEDYEFLGCIGGWPSMACFHRGPLELRKLCKLDEAVPKRNTLEEGKAASLW